VDTRALGERFGELTSRREPEIPLDQAALLIAAHARPSLDLSRELGRLDELAEGCFAPTLDALVTYLFVDLGFAGNRRDYYDARNSYLDQVVTRRLGIPISLGVLTMVLGRRIGVPLVGVGMPGHFLLRDQVDPEVFVDPFGGGRLLDRQGCERAFHAVHGADAPFDDAFLAPVGTVSILTRMLANLRNIFAAHGDRAGVVAVLELRNRLPGASAEDRGELAAALAATGRFGEAAGHYELAGHQLGGSLGAEYCRNADRLRARLN
jgi:regulator of sirC expression with transglutaminase-like and TPR domain